MTYTYPLKSVAPDYARAGLGVLLTGVPALLPSVATAPRVILAGLALLFLGFGLQTAWRHATRLRLTEQGIAAEPLGPRLRWRELSDVRLAYYATRREARDGWMQLTLVSGRTKLAIDSRLEGFVEVVQRAVASAAVNGLALSPTTLNNLSGIHIRVDRTAAGCGRGANNA